MIKEDMTVIMGRINILFKRKLQTFYRIEVVNDKFDHTYNFFFRTQPKNQRISSVPLHTIKNYDLTYLEKLINRIQKQTNLSIEYIGFENLKWPTTNQLIQKRARRDE